MINIKKETREDERLLKNIFNRFKKRDFSGNTGQAIKNSSYQLAQNLVFKFGSLIFTIILARILMPEVMGLYNLSLAIIIFFIAFSDLGVNNSLMTFMPRMLSNKDPENAKGYFIKLFRWKLILTLISSALLLSGAWFIARYIYVGKPIFYALLVGGLYIPAISLLGFIEYTFKSTENFRHPLLKELILQISRLILVPLIVMFFITKGYSSQVIVLITILAITLSYIISLIFLSLSLKKNMNFLKTKSKAINSTQSKELKKFILPLSVTAMAGMFFGYIDTLMLGSFVSGEFIAYYSVAFSLIGGLAAIVGFASTSMMPIFARSSGKKLEEIFSKSRKITLSISIFIAIMLAIFSNVIIKILYEESYMPASIVLRIFSIMIILIPIIGLYSGYFKSQKRTKELAQVILLSTILNIIFNFIGIKYGLLIFGEMGAVIGACVATILSRVVYISGLIIFKNKKLRR